MEVSTKLTATYTHFPQNSTNKVSIRTNVFCCSLPMPSTSRVVGLNRNVHYDDKKKRKQRRSMTIVAAVGDVSADSTNYLIAGAAAVALLGTAFPILFSRKDTCPECDGAGFVRKAGVRLNANAARKDQAQIVCARCNGLGKLNQINK